MKVKHVLASNILGSMASHIAFFWIRVFISMHTFSSYWRHPGCMCILKALKDDNIYVLQFNTFLLYFVLHSLSQGYALGYFLSIIMMIHNAGLTLLIMFINQRLLFRKDIICAGLSAASYIFEAVYAVCISYLKRHEISFELFKKIGANPKINDLYVTRKRLQTFGIINVFVSTAVLGKIIFPPLTKYSAINLMVILIVLLTYAQHIITLANINDENVLQRNIAMLISFVNILLLILTIILTTLYFSACVASTRSIQIFVYADMLIVKIAMSIYLRRDKKNFGSGLKEFFAFRGQVFDLSK